MRIGELSKATNVSVPTIKFYVREGLLPAGRPTASANQVEYDDAHLHRLILLRALIEVGGLSLATVRATVGTLGTPQEAPAVTLHALLAGTATPDSADAAAGPADELLTARGWDGTGAAGPVHTLSAALLALSRLERPLSADALTAYADAADRLAKREVGAHAADGAVSAENTLIDVVLGGAVLASLRELAHLQRVAETPATEPKATARKPDQPKKKKSKKK